MIITHTVTVNEKMRTHLLLFSVIVCASLLFLSVVRCEDETETDEVYGDLGKRKGCAKSEVITTNETKGALKVINDVGDEIRNCTWIIEITKDVTKDPIFFRINGFHLGPSDSFVIKKDKNIIFDKSKISLANTILFTGITQGNVTVELILSKKYQDRVFDVAFKYNENTETVSITPANRNGIITLPIYNPSFVGDVPEIAEFTLDLQLQPPLQLNFTLVVQFEEMTISTKVDIKGVKSGLGEYSPKTPDLIADGSQIQITLKNFNLKEKKSNQMILHYSIYNKECTDAIEIASVREDHTVMFPVNVTDTSLDCLWIVSYKGLNVGYRMDYTKFSFVNDMDFLTVRSGNRRNSSVVAVINNQNKGHVQNSYRDTISMGENLYITYNSPFASLNSYNAREIFIIVMKEGGYFLKPTPISLKREKSSYPVIFILKTDAKRAILESSKVQTLSKGSLNLFDSDEIAGKNPFAVFGVGDAIPKLIVSPTNTMRVELANDTDFEGSLSKTDSELDVVAAFKTASFMATGATLKCSNSSSWLIPKNPEPKANETIYSVQTSYLSLNTSGDTLTLTKYSNKEALIFTIKGAKDYNGQSLPDFLFFANSSYLFKYTRSKDCNPKDNSVLLQLSYNVNHLTDYESTIPLQSGGELTIEPDTYPNNYPLREPDLNTFCTLQNRGCGWFVTPPTNGTVLTTLLDVDLASGDFIDLGPKKIATNELPPDELSAQMFVKMSAPIPEKMVISEKLSGRGFKLNVTEFEYGATLEYPKVKDLKTGNPLKYKTYAWIVKVDEKEKGKNGNYLLFKIAFGKTGTQGTLRIIDSSSMREADRIIKINQSLEFQPASVNQTIVIYEVNDVTKAAALDISFKIEQCKEWCKNGYRCILDSWRCDNVSQCGDWSDEMNCNIPPDCPETPKPKSGGVSGWVIAFVIFPLAMIVGGIIAKFGPTALRRFRGSSYQEFRDFSEVS